MSTVTAEDESTRALAQVYAAIDGGHHFILEAGAGAGKTYSLIKAIEYVLGGGQKSSPAKSWQIACITYTNVARDEIRRRIDNNPSVFCDTIHGFAWDLIAPFQRHIREILISDPRWQERQARRSNTIDSKQVRYSYGFWRITDAEVFLGHDDVIWLLSELLSVEKFRRVLYSRYKYVFIDEYQDANSALMESIKANLFSRSADVPKIGLFGDHWQQIYQGVCGKVDHAGLRRISKGANFRSTADVVGVLNRMRPELPQVPDREDERGEALVLHTNLWPVARLDSGHWKGDLPSDAASLAIKGTRETLVDKGWDIASGNYKVLMLTHRLLAAEQGYPSIPEIYDYSDIFRNLEDPHLEYFVDRLEPAMGFYNNRMHGAMFEALGTRAPVIDSVERKRAVTRRLDDLVGLRREGTVGDVIEFLRDGDFPSISPSVARREDDLRNALLSGEELGRSLRSLNDLKRVKYSEIVSFAKFHHEQSPYATKHGVKGAEFDDVLVVVGRGWSMYNFAQMLDLSRQSRVLTLKESQAYVRNRNLFYVACSRARNRLAILFTQELTTQGLATLEDWFGADQVVGLNFAGDR